MKKETFTIVDEKFGAYYDTFDERFYSDNWERTYDTKEYLQCLIDNNPEKFKGCKIVDNE